VGTLADVTAEVGAEAAMSEARDEATEASRLKSDFLANMSHEIRTPMNGVIGMTDLLLETDLDPRQRDYAQTVRNSGEALLTIINDILDFSKVEAGMLEVENIPFALRDDRGRRRRSPGPSRPSQGSRADWPSSRGPFPESSVATPAGCARSSPTSSATPSSSPRPGEIVVRVTAAAPSIMTLDGRPDPDRTHSTAGSNGNEKNGHNTNNTNGNGNGNNSDGKGRALDSDVVVRFEVTDTGDGIAADKVGEIFQPFVQVDTSTSRRYGGTGLGLAISSQLVALMGGDCGVTSTLGSGSTFWFTIRCPRVGRAGHQRAARRPPRASPGSTP
jgi:two-component system sensor histidine kinase/response regulator